MLNFYYGRNCSMRPGSLRLDRRPTHNRGTLILLTLDRGNMPYGRLDRHYLSKPSSVVEGMTGASAEYVAYRVHVVNDPFDLLSPDLHYCNLPDCYGLPSLDLWFGEDSYHMG